MEEKWADIDGYNGYQVSNMGNIRSLKSMKILKQQEKENGYNTVSLRREGVLKQLYVHRLVALAFREKEEWKNHVDHINCIRNDNRSDNLRWCTPKENCNFPQTRINASKSLKLAMNREDVKEKLANSMKDVFSRRNVKEKMSKASILNHENGLYDHLKKEVLKLDKEGNVLKNYESVSSVANDGYDPSFVSKVCRGDKFMAYGYIWRFK